MLKKIGSQKDILEHISFTHQDPSIFVKSQWQCTNDISRIYYIYRWAILGFFLPTWLISVQSEDNAKWLIYLTNWGYTLCTVQSILSVIMITSSLQKEKSGIEEDYLTRKLYKIYWAVNEIATVVAFNITIIFWSLIYEDDKHSGKMNLITHAFNSIIMFLDLCIVAHPVRLLHLYWSIVFGISYCLFSMVYYLAGGTNTLGSTAIYPILDWNKPGTTMFLCVGILIILVILHVITYGVYRLRVYLAEQCKKANQSDQMQMEIVNSRLVTIN